jgi:hypothetical protein
MKEGLLPRGNVMSSDAYHEVLNRARQLAPDEQLHLMEDLAVMLNLQLESLKSVEAAIRQVEEKLKAVEDAISRAHEEAGILKRHSITELRGLGKGIWKGVDAQEYVNQERDAWDG